MSNFDGIKFFKPDSKLDAWGDPSKISPLLLQKLDQFRQYIDSPVIVTSGYRPQSQGSQHALGLAVDIVAPKFAGSLFDLYLAAERINFAGIGVYPDWLYNNTKVGGLHLDVRTGKTARWIGLGRGDGKNKYIALSSENLKLYGVT